MIKKGWEMGSFYSYSKFTISFDNRCVKLEDKSKSDKIAVIL